MVLVHNNNPDLYIALPLKWLLTQFLVNKIRSCTIFSCFFHKYVRKQKKICIWCFMLTLNWAVLLTRIFSYRAKKQRFPVFICKRHDFMIEIKILPLAAQGEVIQHQMGQIYPAIQQNTDHQKWHSALHISSWFRTEEVHLPGHWKPLDGL